MILLIELFYEFFKIGLFAVGGGMATLPFLQELSARKGWFPTSFIADMVAISESTPGPIGINMATYVGYNLYGLIGGITATLGIIVPAIIIVTTVSKFLDKFKDSPITDYAFYGLRPAVTGLIAAALFSVMCVSFINLDAIKAGELINAVNPVKLVMFFVFFFAIKKFKKHPVFYIAISAAVGVVLGL